MILRRTPSLSPSPSSRFRKSDRSWLNDAADACIEPAAAAAPGEPTVGVPAAVAPEAASLAPAIERAREVV